MVAAFEISLEGHRRHTFPNVPGGKLNTAFGFANHLAKLLAPFPVVFGDIHGYAQRLLIFSTVCRHHRLFERMFGVILI